jgi:hypothetical protein
MDDFQEKRPAIWRFSWGNSFGIVSHWVRFVVEQCIQRPSPVTTDQIFAHMSNGSVFRLLERVAPGLEGRARTFF